jgi:hypothetical protein
MTSQLSSILSKKIRTLYEDPQRSMVEFDCTVEKLQAVLRGDWLAFHEATERELRHKDDQIARERALQDYLSIGLRRLRDRHSHTTLQMGHLLHDPMDESGIAFLLPFDEVKRHLHLLNYYPDSIVDPEESEAMAEYGWRRKLQNHIDIEGRLPQ